MASPDELKAMDLRLKGVNDECLAYGQWTRITAAHTLAKSNSYLMRFIISGSRKTERPTDRL